ncbi:hypothetical protein EUA93_17120 [Nocardioides oleivorans]|uniref:Uncharacterized protein n=1 Tax=Nocardioides oleivorans TaxID=273676 RepID=A0A4Q2RS46_9ACTN|nr:hypothetical protein [Nocardioides oleivorans]RYB91851.1 hypothetical protein EUA93_17120 [Nocardioides oleivorans]
MSKREERERARVMAMLPDEGAVAAEIFASASKLGEPGDVVTPELAELASQVAGAEAAGRWLKAGHSMDDCGTVRRFYEYVGQHIASDVGPGGRLHGVTIPGHDDVDDRPGRATEGTHTLIGGIRYEPALDSDPTALISTAGGFIDGGWDEFRTSRSSTKTDGTWVLNHYPTEDVLALHFIGRNFSGFAEVFKDDIASVRVAAKGLNMVVEVVDRNGQVITAVGPKKRLRNIFLQLGHAL